MWKHGSHFIKLPSLRQYVPKMWKSRSSGECVSIFWNTAAQGKGRQWCRHRRFDHSEPSGQPGHHHGRYFDVGSVSEGIPERRGAGEEICSVGVLSVCVCVREGESVDIEIDSGAEVSCLPACNEAQHVWRSSRCGGWRQIA